MEYKQNIISCSTSSHEYKLIFSCELKWGSRKLVYMVTDVNRIAAKTTGLAEN